MTDQIAFTPETLAVRWQCSAQQVRNLVKAGKLPCFRLGRMYRIPYADVVEFEKPKLERQPDENADSHEAARGSLAVAGIYVSREKMKIMQRLKK